MHDPTAASTQSPDFDASKPPSVQDPSTISVHAMLIARTLDAAGIPSADVFRSVGIAPPLTSDPLSRVPVTRMRALYAACVERTGDPYFGLAVARSIHITSLHVLGHTLATSGCLMDFCQRLQKYWKLVTDGSVIDLEEAGDSLTLHFRLLVDIAPQAEDVFLAFVVVAMRQLHQPSFAPLRVGFHHGAPAAGAGPYEELFLAPTAFGQPGPFLVFRKSDMVLPLIGACAELTRHNDKLASQYLTRLDRSDTVAAARLLITELLPSGQCTREQVARALHMSPSTLQTRLSVRGTSFLGLLDDTRRELAGSYLR